MIRVKNELFSQLYKFSQKILPEGIMVHLWLKIQTNKSLPVRLYEPMCFVDQWPNPSIICGVDKVVQYRGMQRYPYICLWSNHADANALSTFLTEVDKNVGLLSSPSETGKMGGLFCAVADYNSDGIRRYLAQKHYLVEEEVDYQYWMPPDKRIQLKMEDIKPPDGFYFDKLNANDVSLVNETWRFKSPGSHLRMEYRIANLPNIALRECGTDELASFELTHDEHGYMNHLYTVEKFRRRGLATKVELKLAQMLINENDIVPFKLVVKGGTAGKAMSDGSPWWQSLEHLASYISYSKSI